MRSADRAGGESGAHQVKSGTFWRKLSLHLGHNVHDVRVALDGHELGHFDRAEATNPADVIAGEIDEHEVFGAFFFVGEQIFFQGDIFGGGFAARASAGDGANLDLALGEAHVHSRPADAIEREARTLVEGGAREITLLGQNVNAWHGRDGEDLGSLVRRLARLEGLERLRYTTSHPRDMNDGLIEAHAEEPKLMPFLHLPVQSGSDAVLDAMNRGHTVDRFLGIVARLRAARRDLAFSSDFIVGFPGESDADFARTLDLVREVKFAQAYSFKYSPRPGTPAALIERQVPEPVKDARLAELQALLKIQQDEFNAATLGRTVPVLYERAGRNPGQLVGKTPWLQAVHALAPAGFAGRVLATKITTLAPNSLSGTIVDSQLDGGERRSA